MSGRSKNSFDSLYLGKDKIPAPNFNSLVLRWLKDEIRVREHSPAAAFLPVRTLFDVEFELLCAVHGRRNAHRILLSRMTPLLLEVNIGKHLEGRLVGDLINQTGFRTALSQGQAKNNGENFVNAIVYSLASLLSGQDRVLVDKGTPPCLKELLTLKRVVSVGGEDIEFKIPIECDFAIYSRENPSCAIVMSAKTRLKEVFHVGTMWKILFDMAGDDYCEKKWDLRSSGSTSEVNYCFATADMIPAGGAKTQGPDVERDKPRNLIAMDASFFDYVFVSKTGIGHVASKLNIASTREALFHELGCLVDMIEQKFGLDLA